MLKLLYKYPDTRDRTAWCKCQGVYWSAESKGSNCVLEKSKQYYLLTLHGENIYHHLLTMSMIKHDINQQDLKKSDLFLSNLNNFHPPKAVGPMKIQIKGLARHLVYVESKPHQEHQ